MSSAVVVIGILSVTKYSHLIEVNQLLTNYYVIMMNIPIIKKDKNTMVTRKCQSSIQTSLIGFLL